MFSDASFCGDFIRLSWLGNCFEWGMEMWQIETSWHRSLTNRRWLLASPFQKGIDPPPSLYCASSNLSLTHTHPDQAPEGIGFCRFNFRFWTIGNLALSSRKSRVFRITWGLGSGLSLPNHHLRTLLCFCVLILGLGSPQQALQNWDVNKHMSEKS